MKPELISLFETQLRARPVCSSYNDMLGDRTVRRIQTETVSEKTVDSGRSKFSTYC